MADEVTPPKSRRLLIRHATHYRYDKPVERSIQSLHLRPIHDWKQSVDAYKLTVDPAPAGGITDFEDVFSNFMARFEINSPYSQLLIRAESEVQLRDIDPFSFTAHLTERPKFPLVWMPWELKMLQPYLTPQELPDTQLREIYDYAVDIVQRNKLDVIETLFDINLTLFRDYKYMPGSTSLSTTAFDVLSSKQGVCQDFANLFITMARLLHLPARYVCGYVYTGNSGAARAGSDATHAWLQIYIPGVGWKGFDPTNGVLPNVDHVRLGYGRNYRDTTPVSGTLYSPATETMSIDVEMIDLDATTPSPPASSAAPQPMAQMSAPANA